MYQARDPKLTKWLREHPTDTAKVGPSLDLPPQMQVGGSSSSSASGLRTGQAPLPGLQQDHPPVLDPPLPPPPGGPDDLVVFEGFDADDFTSVVNMLVAHGETRCQALCLQYRQGEV